MIISGFRLSSDIFIYAEALLRNAMLTVVRR